MIKIPRTALSISDSNPPSSEFCTGTSGSRDSRSIGSGADVIAAHVAPADLDRGQRRAGADAEGGDLLVGRFESVEEVLASRIKQEKR